MLVCDPQTPALSCAIAVMPIAFVRGTNPAYDLPETAKFAEAFAKVPFKVSFSMFPDETTELCDLILPDLHSLESWGDAEPVRGTIALQQPAMDPVFRTDERAPHRRDVLIQRREEGSGATRRSIHRRTIAAG